jgi:superfamily II DNA or RNA helicase
MEEKKEFAVLQLVDNAEEKQEQLLGIDEAENQELINNLIKREAFLPNNYQQFVANFINPDTENYRILIKHSVGTGKTSTALLAAFNFIEKYMNFSTLSKSSNETENSPSVFILGFSKSAFTRELLKRPEFKFITRNELERIKQLHNNVNTRGTKQDILILKETISNIKRRFTNRKGYGFFKFYGYRAFYNRIFIIEDQELNDKMKKEQLSESQFVHELKNGRIKFNVELLESMKYGLIIADEAHNLFSSQSTNLYGIAIKMILEYHKKNIRCMFLSATIFNSSTEIVELLNLLNSTGEQYQLIKKSDLFYKKNGEVIMKDTAEKTIKDICEGKISFVNDVDPKYFPRIHYEGEQIRDLNKKVVPYLYFTKCVMSPFHTKTYINYFKNKNLSDDFSIDTEKSSDNVEPTMSVQENRNSSQGNKQEGRNKQNASVEFQGNKQDAPVDLMKLEQRVKQDSFLYLIDFALPNPDIERGGKYSLEYGMFDVNDIKYKLNNASESWLKENKIEIISKRSGYLISGDFLMKENIGKYSAKYYNMITDVLDNIKYGKGKMFIFHQFVNTSGSLFIQEILKRNGILDEFSPPVSNTICSKCGKIMKQHQSFDKNCIFTPARFIAANSEIDKATIDKSLDKYNSNDNSLGYQYMILVGSLIIKESFDLKDVQNVMIMYKPDSIPTLIQILGRARRKNSHINLPYDKRKVNVKIYINVLPKDQPSYEMIKYAEKVADYQKIQLIEKYINQSAVDLFINYDTSINGYLSTNMRQNSEVIQKSLGDLHFPYKRSEISKRISENKNVLNMVDHKEFFAYNHSIREVNYIVYCIKRLFLINQIWKMHDLFEAVKLNQSYNIDIHYNMNMIDYDLFVVALYSLVYKINDSYLRNYENFVDKLLNPNDKIIMDRNGNKFVIINFSEYFGLFPITVQTSDNNSRRIYPEIDIENVFKTNINNEVQKLSIKKFNVESQQGISYENKKENFINKYSRADLSQMSQILCKYSVLFHSTYIKDIIEYIFSYFTNKKTNKSINHDFYLKCIYFYDIHGFIIFADAKEKINNKADYKNITVPSIRIPDNSKSKCDVIDEISSLSSKSANFEEKNKTPFSSSTDFEEKNPRGIDARQTEEMDKLLGLNCDWCSSKCIENFNRLYNYARHFDPKKGKVPANILPVGHIFDNQIKLISYDVRNDKLSWLNTGLIKRDDWKEFQIVGFMAKGFSGIETKFKIKPGAHTIKKHKDLRLNPKGALCSTFTKAELLNYLEMVGISTEYARSIPNLCKLLQNRLMYLEINERKKRTNLKYYYNIFEVLP